MDRRHLRPVTGVMCVIAAVAAVFALAGAGAPAGGQTPTTINPLTACAAVTPTIVFEGTAVSRSREVVTFRIDEVRVGEGAVGTALEIVYPTEYNAEELEVGSNYLVTAATVDQDLHSVVQTAELTACGQSTRYVNGSRIDTGVLVGVKDQGPALVTKVGLGLICLLIVLVLLGRFFDRRSRYREQISRA